MKTSEFYERAVHDAAFRRAKLEDLRYLRVVGAGLICFCVILGAAFSLYSGLSEGRWDAGLGLFVAAVLPASTYSIHTNHIAALEAFEKEPNQSLQPTRTCGPRG